MSGNLELFCTCDAFLGEGVCWHPTAQSIWWVDILQGRLFEAALDYNEVRELRLPAMVGAIAPTSRGTLVAALRDGIYEVELTGAGTKLFAVGLHDPTRFRFNDAKVDPQGRLWAGTIGLQTQTPDAHLYRIDSSGVVQSMLAGVTISNGIAWAPGGGTMYFIDTPTRRVAAFDFDVANGYIGDMRVVIEIPPTDGLPDGCTIDTAGNLWIAHWGAGKVTQWNPATGSCLQTISVPVENVTSCAFGGANLNRLFISTARNPARSWASEPLAGSVFVANVDAEGQPISVFDMRAVGVDVA